MEVIIVVESVCSTYREPPPPERSEKFEAMVFHGAKLTVFSSPRGSVLFPNIRRFSDAPCGLRRGSSRGHLFLTRRRPRWVRG